MVLKAENLSVFFSNEEEKETEIIKNISFDIKKGEVLGIVGESGSGKSVTSLAILQLLSSKARLKGRIFFEKDIDLLSLSEKEMRDIRGKKISMIFQEPMTSLNPVITLGNQVKEAIQLHQKISSKEAKQKVIELFNEVRLPRPEKIYNSYPHQVSGGQKQRVMIAMALSCNPSLLIADEPTTALDVTVQKTIIDLLNKIKRDRNMSMIFISHDLALVSEISDSLMIMFKGQIVEYGSKNEIFNNPKSAYTKGLLNCRAANNFHLEKLPVISDFMEISPDGEIVEKSNNDFVLLNQELKQDRLKSIYASKPLVEVKNLKTWYSVSKSFFWDKQEYVKALDDVSFDIYEGETLGIVGESGCGKSTLGKTLLRLIKPTGGDILFEGKSFLELSNKELREKRKDIQLVFQDPYSALNPRITIGQAIFEPMQIHNICDNDLERKQRVLFLLEKVGLNPEYYNRYPHEFSGGQRQRICIARALALNSKFIVCDESVAALDVSVQSQVLNLLIDLRKEFKLTYVFISHDLSVVRFFADRIIIMNKGKIEEIGFSEEVYSNPKKEYTKKLLSSIPKL